MSRYRYYYENKVTVAPTGYNEYLPTMDIKAYLRITTDDDDNQIDKIRTSVCQQVELFIRRDLVPKTRQGYYSIIPSGEPVTLEYDPINMVVEITAENDEELAKDNYKVEGDQKKIVTLFNTYKEVRIIYTTLSYGDNGIKNALLLEFTRLYDALGGDINKKIFSQWKEGVVIS